MMVAFISEVFYVLWEIAKIGMAVGAAWVAFFIYGLIKGIFVISS